MIAFRIKNIKQFMNLLLTTDVFDRYTLEEGVIKTYLTYTLDGLYEKSFYDEDDPVKDMSFNDGYTPWGLVRASCTELIRGKHTPVFMKFVLHGPVTDFPDLPDHQNIKALLIMIRFENTGLTLTTGTSLNAFSMSHDADRYWDSRVRELLSETGVEFEEM